MLSISSDVVVSRVLPLLFVDQISNVYASCRRLRDWVSANRWQLYDECMHMQPHSVNDLPVAMFSSCHSVALSWARDGKLDRKTGPAHVCARCGTSVWYRHGALHRTDGPAVVDNVNRRLCYYQYGELHNSYGPAVVTKRGCSWSIRGLNFNPNLFFALVSISSFCIEERWLFDCYYIVVFLFLSVICLIEIRAVSQMNKTN